MKPSLVEVDWLDARDLHDTCELRDVAVNAKLAHRTTCGYLVFDGIGPEGDRVIVLAHDFDAPDEVGNFSIIPHGWVVSITRR